MELLYKHLPRRLKTQLLANNENFISVYKNMQSSEEEEIPVEEPPSKRGRPAGKADEKPRYRRTAQQISEDKIRIAEMKLQAVRDAEAKKAERKLEQKAERRVEQKATRNSKAAVLEKPLQPALKRSPPAREETPSPPPRSRRQALYDSWFPSSPRRSVY